MSSYIIKTELDRYELSKTVLEMPLRKPKKVTVEVYDLRTVEMNAQQWPYLMAFSEQIKWPMGDDVVKLTAEEWKDILTASYKEEKIRMVPTLSGKSMVMLGLRTSKFGADEWLDWMAFLKWAAAEYGVKVPISKRQAAMYE